MAVSLSMMLLNGCETMAPPSGVVGQSAARPMRSLTAADRLEIQELIARYSQTEDQGDVEGWVDTFTVDGTFQPPLPANAISGRGALEKFATARFQRLDAGNASHWNINIIISPSAEGAQARSYEMVVELLPDGTFRVRSVEVKSDQLRVENGHWRFKSRVNVRWRDAEPKHPSSN
jgi:hypothetical protein